MISSNQGYAFDLGVIHFADKDFLDTLEKELIEFTTKYKCEAIIAGDFNGRTGTNLDHIELNTTYTTRRYAI